MKLSWMFGSSMEAHHLLWTYLSVWIIQGGYFAWTVWQWKRTSGGSAPEDSASSGDSTDL